QAEAAAALLRSRALLDLVTGSVETLPAARFQELFGFSPEGLSCAVVVVDEEPLEQGEPGSTRTQVSDAIAEVAGASRRALVFSPGEGRQAVLVLEQDPPSCERLAATIAARAAAVAPEVIVGVGRPRGTWRGAASSFLEAAAALSCRLAGPVGVAFHYGRDVKDDAQTLAALAEKKERTRRAVVSGEPRDAETKAADYLGLLGRPGVSPTRVRHEIEALFASILDSLRDMGVSSQAVAQDLELDYDLAVQRLRTSEGVQALLRRLAAYAGSVLNDRAIPAPEWKVRDFKDYVARHYGDRALSVQSIAASLAISASYLSKLVKKHMDRSVVDYLVDFRMERAKELLATSDLMTRVIAEATGYPDA
ncbi:MAG TPA: helix-turn-helix domain-containing protein, partial [bacterium]|nr:helix-turn-helix domain-containing protein [bacterium]